MRIKINEEVYLVKENKVFIIQNENFGATVFGCLGSIISILLLVFSIWAGDYWAIAFTFVFLVGSALIGLINKEVVIDFNKNEITVFKKLANYVLKGSKTKSFSNGIYFSVRVMVDEKYGNSYFLYTTVNRDEFAIASLSDYETGEWLIKQFQEANPKLVFVSE